MKSYASLLIIILCFGNMTSQNFKAADGKITWQKVYDSELTQQQIGEIMTRDAQLAAAAANFRGRTEPVGLNCEGSIPIYMEALLDYFVTIEFKEGRYRVTASDLQLTPLNTISIYGVEDSGAPVALEKYQLRSRDGELRKNNLAMRSLECMDQYLSEKFEFKELTESAEAW